MQVRLNIWLVLFCLVMLRGGNALTAAAQIFPGIPSDTSVSAYRYRIGEDPWIDVESSRNTLNLPRFDSEEDVLSIQQYSAINGWGPILRYRFDKQSTTWVMLKESERTVRFSISNTDASVVAFRYQSGYKIADAWKVIDAQQAFIMLPWFDTDQTLFIQQSWDRLHWSEYYAYRYDPVLQHWSLVQKPKTKTESYTLGLYAAANLTTPSTSHLYAYSVGGTLESSLRLPFDRRFAIILDASVHSATSNNIWTDSFRMISSSLGFGYQYPLGKAMYLLPSVSYGILANVCDSLFYIDQYIQGTVRVVFPLSPTLLGSVKAKGLVLLEDGRIGLFTGFEAGLQFAW